MTMIECHDCRIPLDSDTAYFDPIKIVPLIRCLDCHKSIRVLRHCLKASPSGNFPVENDARLVRPSTRRK